MLNAHKAVTTEELDALYVASSYFHGLPISTQGVVVKVPNGTGRIGELVEELLDEWGQPT